MKAKMVMLATNLEAAGALAGSILNPSNLLCCIASITRGQQELLRPPSWTGLRLVFLEKHS